MVAPGSGGRSWGGHLQVQLGRQGSRQIPHCPSPCAPGGALADGLGLPRSSFFHPGSHLEGVEGGLWGALQPPLKLYIQDVEQVRGLGLAREVDAELEAADSARAIVVELVRVAEY